MPSRENTLRRHWNDNSHLQTTNTLAIKYHLMDTFVTNVYLLVIYRKDVGGVSKFPFRITTINTQMS